MQAIKTDRSGDTFCSQNNSSPDCGWVESGANLDLGYKTNTLLQNLKNLLKIFLVPFNLVLDRLVNLSL